MSSQCHKISDIRESAKSQPSTLFSASSTSLVPSPSPPTSPCFRRDRRIASDTGDGSSSGNVPMPSDTQQDLGVKEHSDIKKHSIKKFPDVHKLLEDLLQPNHSSYGIPAGGEESSKYEVQAIRQLSHTQD